MSPEVVLFWVFSVATVIAASGVVIAKNPIGAAMSLVPIAGQVVNTAGNYAASQTANGTAGGQLGSMAQGATTGSTTQSTSSGLTAQPNDPTVDPQGYRVRGTGWSPRRLF